MPGSNPIYWSQGLFLQPQHFQQQDRYHEDQVRASIRLLGPNAWGVRRLDIRERGLDAAIFEVAYVEAVTRDGTVLVGGSEAGADANAVVPPRSLTQLDERRPREIGVYLAVARVNTSDRTVITAAELIGGQILPQRYVLGSRPVRDCFEPVSHEEINIQILQCLAQIFFDTDPGFDRLAASFEVIPVARLTATDRGALLHAEYLAPALCIAALPSLLRRLKDFRDAVDRRTQDFGRLKRERGIRATLGTAQDNLRLMILQTLSRHSVTIHQITEQTGTHPETLYTALRVIVGELAAFSEDYTALGATSAGDGNDVLPAYDHQNISSCISSALEKAHLLLSRLATGPADSIELKYDSTYFTATIPPSFFEGRLPQYFMVIDSELTGDQLAQALRNAKISSRGEMDRLRNSALYGLKTERLPYPPEQLPQRAARFTYFEIDQKDHFWNLIKAQENIVLHCPELDASRTRVMIVKTVSE